MIRDGIALSPDGMNAFLMIGQSNMAGRGEFADVKPIENPLCHMLRMGRWQPMREPVNPDRGIFEGPFHSGVSLAASFADEAARTRNAPVGLIPCADGGTRIDQWMPGEILFDHAVAMTRLAMRTAVLRGILWHQGESDCADDASVAAYHAKFTVMMTALRRELDAENVPVILGELSTDIGPSWGCGDRPGRMNAVFREIAKDIPHCALASARGLTLKPDGIHFDAPSCRELGRRYFAAYCSLAEPKGVHHDPEA